MVRLLERFGIVRRPKAIEPAVLPVGERAVPVSFRRNARARRLILRLSRDRRGVVVTMPPRVGRDEALDFARKSIGWIERRLKEEPSSRPLAPGSTIPIRGEPRRIEHNTARRGTVTLVEDAVLVSGDAAHIRRRLADWLKTEARRDLVKASDTYALAMGVAFRRLSVRDQKSRWGSCSSDGTLSYSWRLILAPSYVLDYVVAHEIAHLRFMNHGRRFWRLVLTHCPDAQRAKNWLRKNGAELHAYEVRAKV